MTEERFLAWAVDIEWALRKLKWGCAITCALLALVLTA
jgi:hypothetical protein